MIIFCDQNKTQNQKTNTTNNSYSGKLIGIIISLIIIGSGIYLFINYINNSNINKKKDSIINKDSNEKNSIINKELNQTNSIINKDSNDNILPELTKTNNIYINNINNLNKDLNYIILRIAK